MHRDEVLEWILVHPTIEQKVAGLEYHRRNPVAAEAERQAFWECAACDFPLLNGSIDPNRGASNVMRHAEQRYV